MALMNSDKYYLDLAAEYAKKNSTCLKVAVGALFAVSNEEYFLSANHGKPSCKELGECHKFKVTGIYESCEKTRKYCAATHAEINVLHALKEEGIDLSNGVLFVTRYPCVNCATEVCKAGVKKVVYGGRQEISDEVKKLFDDNHVEVTWHPECDYED